MIPTINLNECIGDVPKGHFVAVSRKIAFDYKHIANDKSLEQRLFKHPHKEEGKETGSEFTIADSL
jgi:hypothetical protein